MKNNMIPIRSVSEINFLKKRVKDKLGRVVSNYTIFPQEAQKWIDSGSLFYSELTNGIYLIHEGSRVNEIFFFSDCYDSVTAALNEIEVTNKKPSVMEIIRKDFESPMRINPFMVLNRMSSTSIPFYKESGSFAPVLATIDDISEIENILLNNFSPVAERIPTKTELESFLSNSESSGVYIVRGKDKINGLLIYSKDPSTIHLRYWWTDSGKRGLGIGSSLLNQFFKKAEGCKRMILWVNTENKNAIDKYSHYGFSSEDMFDYIFTLENHY